MMMRLVLLAALLGLAAAGKADRPQEAFYQTYMRNRASNGRSSVSTASGDYPDTSVSASLTQSQISQCRVLGCPYCEQEDIPWGAHFQTDFTCNPDLQHEERSYEREHKINMVGVASEKVGICEWDFSIYRAGCRQDFIPGDILPVFDTTSLKLGSATGTCYFNSDVDSCDGPFCDTMSITVQGGIYIAVTYSEFPTNILSAPLGDTCNPFSGRLFNNREALMTPVDKTNTNFTRRDGDPLSGALMEAIKRTPIWEKAQQIAGESSSSRAQAADASASVAAGSYGRRENEPLYAGLSLIITGPASISSMKHLKVEETGHLEYVPLFIAFTDSATGKYDLPYVRGGALKINFREEERHYRH